MYSRSAVATMYMHASLSTMRVSVVLLVMLVNAAMLCLSAIVPLVLSLLIMNLIMGMIALDHPGMVLFARSVCPIVTSIIAVLTPTLCRVIFQVGAYTVG